MQLPFYQVDAFTRRRFAGNPAAVVPLEAWLDDALLLAIARENNLSETAYFTGADGRYRLRWFTPGGEVDLCGHATLATAFVIRAFHEPGRDALTFASRSGELIVRADGARLELDFPTRRGAPCDAPADLVAGLGVRPLACFEAPYFMALLEDEAAVRGLRPDFARLARLDRPVIVTAAGDEVDFVSRFFAPTHGIDEDPVTGSAHCTLTPYWAERLGKRELIARQVSARGGELACEDRGDRTLIAGEAVLVIEGRLALD
jgi:PhzF family phenazine biosynthesis protein